MNTLFKNVFGKVNSLPHGYQIAGCATFGGAVFMAAALAAASVLVRADSIGQLAQYRFSMKVCCP